ncbi:MAG: VWA domain-containing protein [Chloroflexi bacterium]|nr:VWA domain-containing protein [Chloroflexota bacterium]
MDSQYQQYDLYTILGVSPSASADDIKTAYRQAARRFHPDVNGHEGASLQFKDINLAYEVLSDEIQRSTYHRVLTSRAATKRPSFAARCIPSRRILPVIKESQVMYLLLEIVARSPGDQAVNPNEPRKAPLNIALVLDHSSSMRGARLEKVKVASHQILSQLGHDDRLCVVAFSDRADVLVKSEPVTDPEGIKSRVNTIAAGGGTEIFQGLSAAYQEVKRYFNRKCVNHVILITDGRTYGDEQLCLELADDAKKVGVSISAMGIGDEWNDVFLDDLTAKTGGGATYVNSPGAVVNFLNDRVRTLSEAFAERLRLTVAPDSDVRLESGFRLSPSAQPLEVKSQPINLGALQSTRPTRVLLQFQMPPDMKPGFRSMVRLDITGDLIGEAERYEFKAIVDQTTEVSTKPPPEEPPKTIIDALGKLALYRMQQKAEKAINDGQVQEATRRLENLATRLLQAGQEDLAHMAMEEARRVRQTSKLSEEGRKTLKFGTRSLMLPPPDDDKE